MVSKTFMAVIVIVIMGMGSLLYWVEYQFDNTAVSVQAELVAINHKPRSKLLSFTYQESQGQSASVQVKAAFWQEFQPGEKLAIKVDKSIGLEAKLDRPTALYRLTIAFIAGVLILAGVIAVSLLLVSRRRA
jgi:hypothetical protein